MSDAEYFKTLQILKLISQGYNYEQILNRLNDVNYLDIFNAAQKALEHITTSQENKTSAYQEKIQKIRQSYPRAFEKWIKKEEDSLINQFKQGVSIEELAHIFQRGQGGITAKLEKLGLIETKQYYYRADSRESKTV